MDMFAPVLQTTASMSNVLQSATPETRDFARAQMDAHSAPWPLAKLGSAQQTVQPEHQHFQLRSLENFPKPVSYYSPNVRGQYESAVRDRPGHGEVQQRRRGLAMPDHAVSCVPCSTDRELASLEPLAAPPGQRRFRVPLSSFLRVRCTEFHLPRAPPALALIVNSHMINLSA